MPITDLLERNAKLYGNETALVEINPEIQEKQPRHLEGIRPHHARPHHALSPGDHLAGL